MASKETKDFLVKLMQDETGGNTCKVCSKSFTECIDNIFSDMPDMEFMFDKIFGKQESDIFKADAPPPFPPPLRGHDIEGSGEGNAPLPLTLEARIKGLQVQVNYLLDEIESLLDVVAQK